MNESKIILFETKYSKIIDYVFFIILISYTILSLFDSIPPIWYILVIIIFFYGYIERSVTSSNSIYIEHGELVITYNKVRKRIVKHKILNIDKILIHWSSGRLDRYSLLLHFNENSEKKFIYFAGNDKDCEKLVAGLKNAGISVLND